MILSPLWIFLDFDGVIMDSMALKLDAYAHALAEYGFARERVRELQLKYAGLSRALALPLMFADLSGGPMPEEAQARAFRLFAEEDIRLRPRMRLQPGAREFLEEASKRLPLVVVTGTPQEVIDGTVDLFDLRRYFREVLGSPPVKADHLRALLQRHALQPDQELYVGDTVQDIRAAESAGIPFVGVDNGDHPFEGLQPVAILSGLRELPALLGWEGSPT